jgi:hypothetical protein
MCFAMLTSENTLGPKSIGNTLLSR